MYIHIEVPNTDEHRKGFPQYWLKRAFINSISTSYQVNALAVERRCLSGDALVVQVLRVLRFGEEEPALGEQAEVLQRGGRQQCAG